MLTSPTGIERRSFMINHVLLQINKDLALTLLWKEYLDFVTSFNVIENKGVVDTIFFHNLGSFDGYFLYKALLNYAEPSNIETIIDDANKFITITFNSPKGCFIFKDSLRIFPVPLTSLEEGKRLNALCKLFGVEGQISKYNKSFNTISLFDNPELLNTFISYGLQDSVSLAVISSLKSYINLVIYLKGS